MLLYTLDHFLSILVIVVYNGWSKFRLRKGLVFRQVLLDFCSGYWGIVLSIHRDSDRCRLINHWALNSVPLNWLELDRSELSPRIIVVIVIMNPTSISLLHCFQVQVHVINKANLNPFLCIDSNIRLLLLEYDLFWLLITTHSLHLLDENLLLILLYESLVLFLKFSLLSFDPLVY